MHDLLTISINQPQSLTKLLARTKRIGVAPSPPFECCMQPKRHVKGVVCT